MTNATTKPDSLQPAAEMAVDLFDNWFDPIETEVRARSRQFIEDLLRGEMLRWQGRVTGEARSPAMNDGPALRDTATAADAHVFGSVISDDGPVADQKLRPCPRRRRLPARHPD